MSTGIFTILCPACGEPYEMPHEGPAGDVPADDVLACRGCSAQFVIRFGCAMSVSPTIDAEIDPEVVR